MATIKIIEVIGSSEHGWEEAVHNAVKSAAKTLRQLVGADVQSWTAFASRCRDEVEFEVSQGPKGLQATNVVVLG